MNRKKFLLFMTIFMIVITTAIMLLAFAYLPVSKLNFFLITLMNILGYLTAGCYYDSYRKIKMEGGDND
jgi:hypothetical protein